MLKYFYQIIFIQFLAMSVTGQLKLADFPKIRLGTVYEDIDYRQSLLDRFTMPDKEYNVFKGDFLNTYKIEFNETQFDYYGEADYTFQYIKDTFSNIEIEFNFPADKITNFERFINQFIEDLNSDPAKELNKKTNTLNIQKAISAAKLDCKATTDLGSINSQNFGRGMWILKGNTLSQYIIVEVQLRAGSRGFKDPQSPYGRKSYSGGLMLVRIVFLNDKTWDLYLLNERQSHSDYKQILKYYNNKIITWDPNGKSITNEPSNTIKLKEQDGVYKLPIRINNVLTLDFTLDLGASDVSLSKDVFLVLYKAGTIDENDFIGNENYQLADGSIIKSGIFNLKTVTIGEKQIKNVRASISKSINAPLLLGLSALKKLKSYKIDVIKNLLIIE